MTAPGPHHLWTLHEGLSQQFPVCPELGPVPRAVSTSFTSLATLCAVPHREPLAFLATEARCWLVVSFWSTTGQPLANHQSTRTPLVFLVAGAHC